MGAEQKKNESHVKAEDRGLGDVEKLGKVKSRVKKQGETRRDDKINGREE